MSAEAVAPLARTATVEDWSQAIVQHGLAGVLARNCRSALRALPEAFGSAAERIHRFRVPLALAQLKLVAEASRALDAAEIPFVPFKGIALSMELYEDPAVRESVDVDLLIDPDDLVEALRALESVGLFPAFDRLGSSGVRKLLLECSHHVVLTSPDGGVCELHWRTEPAPWHSLPRLRDFVHTLPTLQIGPATVRTLDRERLAAVVGTHAARSLCRCWRWGYDVLEIASEGGDRWPPNLEMLNDHGRICVDIMAHQLGLPPTGGSRRSPRVVRALERDGVMRRRAYREWSSLSSMGRAPYLVRTWVGILRFEESWSAGLRRLGWYAMSYSPDRNPKRAELVARVRVLAPVFKVAEMVGPRFQPVVRRARRAGWAGALLVALPAASLWRRYGFRVGSGRGSEASEAPQGELAPSVRDLAVAALWLDARSPRPLNCLTLALAARWLVRLTGEPAELRVGVLIERTGEFQSHAWLLSRGTPVTGGPLREEFREIWRSGEQS